MLSIRVADLSVIYVLVVKYRKEENKSSALAGNHWIPDGFFSLIG